MYKNVDSQMTIADYFDKRHPLTPFNLLHALRVRNENTYFYYVFVTHAHTQGQALRPAALYVGERVHLPSERFANAFVFLLKASQLPLRAPSGPVFVPVVHRGQEMLAPCYCEQTDDQIEAFI